MKRYIEGNAGWLAAGFGAAGLAWNLFGIQQMVWKLTNDVSGFVAAGMTAEQATLYAGLPLWMDAAFAASVITGAIGSVLLALRNRLAEPVLGTSLAVYLALFAGDAALGLFTAIPNQLPVLVAVVAIAAALFFVARKVRQAGGAAGGAHSTATAS